MQHCLPRVIDLSVARFLDCLPQSQKTVAHWRGATSSLYGQIGKLPGGPGSDERIGRAGTAQPCGSSRPSLIAAPWAQAATLLRSGRIAPKRVRRPTPKTFRAGRSADAFSLPIALGYTTALTVASWVAGVAVSAVALFVASRGSLTWRRLTGGALAMGAGICAMHYTGMAALDMAPGIVWNPLLVAASAVIAVGASAAALLIFFWLRKIGAWRGLHCQALAALVMGVAICGMHYTGMAAANFPAGTVCLSNGHLSLSGPTRVRRSKWMRHKAEWSKGACSQALFPVCKSIP
jgi:hypothetical protein